MCCCALSPAVGSGPAPRAGWMAAGSFGCGSGVYVCLCARSVGGARPPRVGCTYVPACCCRVGGAFRWFAPVGVRGLASLWGWGGGAAAHKILSPVLRD